MTKVKKAVIPAAGFGTRFLPATKAQPKEMLPIVDKPTIQFIVEEVAAAGIEDLLIITGRNKRSIEDHFDKSVELELALEKSGKLNQLEMVKNISDLVNINYVRQKEQKGLGHAILCAKSFIGDEPFAVLLGDDIVVSKTPCIKQLIDVYEKLSSPVLGVKKVDESDVDKYGIIDGQILEDRLYKAKSMIEKPNSKDAPSDVAVLGRYLLTPDIFEILENLPPGKGGEIQLTDALNIQAQKKDMYAYEFEGNRYDAGDKLGFLKATVDFALEREDLKNAFGEYLKNRVKSI